MSSPNKNQLTIAESVHEQIICQQANLLAKMKSVAVVQKQEQEDQRVREEDALHVIEAEEGVQVVEARAMKMADKKAKQRLGS